MSTPSMNLLELVNMALSSIGARSRWKSLPTDNPQFTPLKGRDLVIVDDSRDVLEIFLPYLVVATEGRTYGIFVHQEKIETAWDVALEALVVLEKKAADGLKSVILMDYDLDRGLTGRDVTNELRKNGFEGVIIGFSGMEEDYVRSDFLAAGANAFVLKKTAEPEETVARIGEVLKAV